MSAPSVPSTPVAALQDALAAEHAALYVVGVLGGQAAQSPSAAALETRLRADYGAHRRRRDRLTALLVNRSARPVAAAPSYRLPNAAANPRQVESAARVVEQRCAAVYGQLVGATAGSERAFALSALDEVAVAALRYGASPTSFPGLSAPPSLR